MALEVPFQLQCVTLSGEDALEFAQSQLTADLTGLPQDQWTPSGWCDAKGRTIAILLVAPRPEQVRLALPEPLAADVVKRLTMFTIGRKVTISAPVALAPGRGSGTGMPLVGDRDRVLVIDENAEPAEWARWLHSDIEQNMAWLLPATSAQFLPQMLDLERRGGLSYRKGCWPGQEVVARVHYRGSLKRRAQSFTDAGTPPEPGARITVEGRSATVLYALAVAGDETRHCGVAVVDVPDPRLSTGAAG